MTARHSEGHKIGVGGWLRAAVLGANDGVVSIASLVIGVTAAAASNGAIFTAGLAGLVGGARSEDRPGGYGAWRQARICSI